MKVLVACEYSGRVRDAFIRNGHEAMSCDILPSDRPGPHYQGDVLDLIGHESFDLMVAHPPCTYLARSGARWLYSTPPQPGRLEKLHEAAAFFRALWEAPIERIAVENPIMLKLGRELIGVGPRDQSIHPYMFGHVEAKTTHLWLKNLPLLVPTGEPENSERNAIRYERFTLRSSSAHERSETFQGIADAMGDQWGAL